jgi:CMP-N-acetylneuraminic acid synthetase
VFDAVFVATEDTEIEEFAKSHGVHNIGQPMASDTSTNVDVVKYAAELLNPDSIMLLQCTSPLRTAEHIREAAGHMRTFETIVSVTSAFDGVYLQNGAIYGATTDFIKRTGRLYDDSSFLYLMDQESSVDIDTETDWKIAEALMQARLK